MITNLHLVIFREVELGKDNTKLMNVVSFYSVLSSVFK